VPPLVGALLKNEQDVTLFEKLVFMQPAEPMTGPNSMPSACEPTPSIYRQ
jgi:hypothetical protein